MLRGQGRNGDVTTNFDACRDLSGRRLRHADAAKKLQEWRACAQEREASDAKDKADKHSARSAEREAAAQV